MSEKIVEGSPQICEMHNVSYELVYYSNTWHWVCPLCESNEDEEWEDFYEEFIVSQIERDKKSEEAGLRSQGWIREKDIKVKAHFDIIKSKIDSSGNSYYALVAIRNRDRATARGIISGDESNCKAAAIEIYGVYENFTYTVIEVPYREYVIITKNWPDLGCTAKEISSNVEQDWFAQTCHSTN